MGWRVWKESHNSLSWILDQHRIKASSYFAYNEDLFFHKTVKGHSLKSASSSRSPDIKLKGSMLCLRMKSMMNFAPYSTFLRTCSHSIQTKGISTSWNSFSDPAITWPSWLSTSICEQQDSLIMSSCYENNKHTDTQTQTHIYIYIYIYIERERYIYIYIY